jgi:hypothetical protein
MIAIALPAIWACRRPVSPSLDIALVKRHPATALAAADGRIEPSKTTQ